MSTRNLHNSSESAGSRLSNLQKEQDLYEAKKAGKRTVSAQNGQRPMTAGAKRIIEEPASSKDKRIIFLLVAAIAAAIIAGVLSYLWLSPQKTTIYIFKDNYSAGTEITTDMLTPVKVDSKVAVASPRDNTDSNVVFVTGDTEKEYIENKTNTLRIDVAKGVPLMKSMLSVDGGSYIEQTMDEGKVAVTVPVTSTSGVTDDLKAGSRVNIYAIGYSNNESNGATLLFQNMRVLSVTKNNNSITAATIEVSIDESKVLVDAATNASLYFGLVNGSGYQAEVPTTKAAPTTTATKVANTNNAAEKATQAQQNQ